MLGVIQRVISGDDMQNEPSAPLNRALQSQVNVHQDETSSGVIATGISSPQAPPALVESDMEVDVNTAHFISSSTPRSSLSDMSDAVAAAAGLQEEMEDMVGQRSSDIRNMQIMELQHVAMQQRHADIHMNNMPRNDSKLSNSNDTCSSSVKGASSQNSSRDWGWFEEIHLTEHQTPLKRKDNTSDKDNPRKNRKPRTPSSEVVQLRRNFSHDDAAAMAVTAPTYVLEESLSSQKLWKYTAGQRPPQPVEERAFFEKMWAQNFTRSQVEYKMPVDVLTATTPFSLSPFADGNFDSAHIRGPEISNYNLALVPASSENTDSNTVSKTTSHVAEATLISRLNDPMTPQHHYSHSGDHALQSEHSMPMVPRIVKGTGKDDGDLAVMIKGDNVFGTTVSKSFARPSDKGGPIVGVDTINISVASYRVVESKKYGKYAQFLVIYREGSIRDTIGVWKRYSDFQELSKKVTQAHEGCAAVIANMSPLAMAEEHEVEHLPNAITSWRLLKKRQRWYRCLDAGYLSLKVFLLERFLHDILFESSSPNLLRDFVGADTSH